MTDQILGKTSEIMDYGRARRVDKTKDLINGRHDALIDSETECLDYTRTQTRYYVQLYEVLQATVQLQLYRVSCDQG